MSLFVDSTYIGMMGSRLTLFRRQKQNLYNFRCPICGDSTKNQFKARGYFYQNDSGDGYNFVCHNCGASQTLYTFIKLLFPEYLKSYSFEKFVSTGTRSIQTEEAIPFKKLEAADDLVLPVDMLPRNHPAVSYLLDKRKLPVSLLEKFFYVESYSSWLKETTKNEDMNMKDHPRILIPYVDDHDRIYRYIARSLDPAFAPKYLYTDVDEGSPFYNWYSIDRSRKVLVVEGAIDSMLLPNSIAIGNAKYSRSDLCSLADYVIISDNEPRNYHVVRSLGKAIDAGHPVFIWPDYYGKDINESVINGTSIDDIVRMVNDNTFSGIRAKMKFDRWRKC